MVVINKKMEYMGDSSSSIWLPLREGLLAPKRTLREFLQIFWRLP